ncbi:Acetyltransferase (isoleucine patch superfamily) [Methylobacterium sp. 275MFSha3.1]|uniref:acyltransferase n=1 Tax=Methylobacterium sp. 275MFSha3.1 TaxID=1502746 RepID=UPI0008A7CE46|nr:acyltransferase [Methylobacterium sp. 275MFSha3.1]SEI10093.1 Acetyltransferase (isoleucine patch superfamily) [Methylobacterium sp. 275MFSha3.1]
MENHESELRRSAVTAFCRLRDRLGRRLPHAVEEIFLQKGLIVHAADMPSWWHDGGNILVKPPAGGVPPLSYVGTNPPRNAIVVIGSNCNPPSHIFLAGEAPHLFLGPQCSLPNGTIICGEQSTIVLAGNLFAIHAANLDARNGGLIYVGDDNLWSSNVKIATDDMHAIFDHANVKRLNRFGSNVSIGTHVWLGLDVLINPGATISDNVVVGSRAVVTKTIPKGCVAVGAPARVIRRQTTWTREDIRPDVPTAGTGVMALEREPGGLLRRLSKAVAGPFRRFDASRR